ncbi:hypothetical protein Taro_001226, partial [Colocasia esculenta]|nr:hypothetical protein [Colocasia esculenta]
GREQHVDLKETQTEAGYHNRTLSLPKARGKTRTQAAAKTWLMVQPQGTASTKCPRGGKLNTSNTEQTRKATHKAYDQDTWHNTRCQNKHQEPPKVQHNAPRLQTEQNKPLGHEHRVPPQAPKLGKMQHSCNNDRNNTANRKDSPQETCHKPPARSRKSKRAENATPAVNPQGTNTRNIEKKHAQGAVPNCTNGLKQPKANRKGLSTRDPHKQNTRRNSSFKGATTHLLLEAHKYKTPLPPRRRSGPHTKQQQVPPSTAKAQAETHTRTMLAQASQTIDNWSCLTLNIGHVALRRPVRQQETNTARDGTIGHHNLLLYKKTTCMREATCSTSKQHKGRDLRHKGCHGARHGPKCHVKAPPPQATHRKQRKMAHNRPLPHTKEKTSH